MLFYWYQIQCEGKWESFITFKDMLKWFPKYSKREHSIWTHDTDNGSKWFKVYNFVPSENCQCGRPYRDPKTYTEFKFRDSLLDNPRTIKDQIAWLNLPILCKFCYYRNCYNRGDWCPKEVLIALGVPVSNEI